MEDAIKQVKTLLRRINGQSNAIEFLMDLGLTNKTAQQMVREIKAGAPWY